MDEDGDAPCPMARFLMALLGIQDSESFNPELSWLLICAPKSSSLSAVKEARRGGWSRRAPSAPAGGRAGGSDSNAGKSASGWGAESAWHGLARVRARVRQRITKTKRTHLPLMPSSGCASRMSASSIFSDVKTLRSRQPLRGTVVLEADSRRCRSHFSLISRGTFWPMSSGLRSSIGLLASWTKISGAEQCDARAFRIASSSGWASAPNYVGLGCDLAAEGCGQRRP